MSAVGYKDEEAVVCMEALDSHPFNVKDEYNHQRSFYEKDEDYKSFNSVLFLCIGRL